MNRIVKLFVATALPLLLLSGCADKQTPTEQNPQSDILDALHNGGNAHFYFLAPLVPNPSYKGIADGTLKPNVNVCEWAVLTKNCVTQVAVFTTSSGTGSEVVRYDATNGFYIVNWKTDVCTTGPCTLGSGKTYRVFVRVGLVELGHLDVIPVTNGSEFKNVDTGLGIPLLNGKTLPVKFRIEQGAIAVISGTTAAPVSSNGGLVSNADGDVGLVFPSGAVTSTTPITIEEAPQAPPTVGTFAEPVDLGPDGTTFSQPVTLSLKYDAAQVPAGVPSSALAVFTSDGNGWVEVAGSVVDEMTQTVTAPIQHFSYYVIQIRPNYIAGKGWEQMIRVGDITHMTGQISYRAPDGTMYPSTAGLRFFATHPAAVSVPTDVVTPDATGKFVSPPITAIALGTGNVCVQLASKLTNDTVSANCVYLAVASKLNIAQDTMRVGIGQIATLTPTVQASTTGWNYYFTTATNGTAGIRKAGTTAFNDAAGTRVSIGQWGKGTTSAPVNFLGVATGNKRFELIGDNYDPDTIVVVVGKGKLKVAISASALTEGDSTQITVTAVAPDSSAVALNQATTVSLTSSCCIEFRSVGQAVTTVTLPTTGSATFFVKTNAPGSATIWLTNADYEVASATISIAPKLWQFAQVGSAFYGFGNIFGFTPEAARIVSLYSTFVLNGGTWTPGELPPSQFPVGVWGTSMNSLVAAPANSGPFLHWNGTSWAQVANTPNAGYAAIWGVADDAIWAVGGTTIARWDGQTWTGSASGISDWLLGFWGTSRSNLYASAGGGNIRRFDGTSWSTMSSGTTQHLWGIWGTSSNNIFAVGSNGTIVRYNGTTWSTMTSGTTARLNKVFGTSSKDVYAVGENGTVLRFDGTSWSPMPTGRTDNMVAVFAATTPAKHAVYVLGGPAYVLTNNGSPISATNVAVTPASAQLELAEKVQLNATVQGSDGGELPSASVKWGTTNASVATVDASGYVTPVGVGATSITATRDGVGASAQVTVLPPVKSVEVAPTAIELFPGDSQPLTAVLKDKNGAALTGYAINWTSSNSAVATVDANGVVTGVAEGNASITATSFDRNASAQVTVIKPLARAFGPISGGSFGMCAIKSDSTLGCWGSYTPPPPGLTGVAQVSMGYSHACALKTDGSMVCWGSNSDGQSAVPANVGSIARIATGNAHTCALRTNGTLACWGANARGQVTIPTFTQRIISVGAGGDFTCAVLADGSVQCWGYNGYGGATPPSGLTSVKDIALGRYHTCALKNDGTVACWGYNTSGQTTVPAGLAGVKTIALAVGHTCASKTDGTVVCWGSNGFGESAVPAGLPYTTHVGVGQNGWSCALLQEVRVICWGNSAFGATTPPADLAIPVTSVEMAPTSASIAVGETQALTATLKNSSGAVVTGYAASWSSSNPAVATVDASGVVTAVAPGNTVITALSYTKSATSQITVVTPVPQFFGPISDAIYTMCAVRGNGTVACWGNNNIPQPPAGLTNVVQVVTGWSHACALKNDGTMVCWGDNTDGQTNVPTTLRPISRITTGYSHTCALQRNGVLVCWGANLRGQTTVPAFGQRAIAVEAGGERTCAVLEDSTAQCWGLNTYNAATPPTGLTGVKDITSGRYHSCALKTNGTVVCWGNATNIGTVPTGLSNAVAIAAGAAHTCAVKSDGGVACWGSNGLGESTPLADLPAATHVGVGENGWSCARTTLGYVMCWGSAVGNQTNPPAGLASPVQTVTVAPVSGQVSVGGKLQLTGAVTDASGNALNGFPISWSTSNSGIATVDAQGLVTGIGAGTTAITAASYGKVGTAQITVTSSTSVFDRIPNSEIISLGAPLAINSGGDIIGSGSAGQGGQRAVRASVEAGLQDLGLLENCNQAVPRGVNDTRTVIGYQFCADGMRAFAWTLSGGLSALPDSGFGALAHAINNNGTVAGFVYTRTKPVIAKWDGTSLILGRYATNYYSVIPSQGSEPMYINDRGDVAGTLWRSITGSDGVIRVGFVMSPDGFVREIGSLGGDTYVTGVNNNGTIVGYSAIVSGDFHAFRWTVGTGIQDLGTLGGGRSQAVGVNDSETVVGWSYLTGTIEARAFRWTPSAGLENLGLLAGSSGFTIATAINNAGMITGYGTTSESSLSERTFRWTPSGGFENIGAVTGAIINRGYAINARGDVAGSSQLTTSTGWEWGRWRIN